MKVIRTVLYKRFKDEDWREGLNIKTSNWNAIIDMQNGSLEVVSPWDMIDTTGISINLEGLLTEKEKPVKNGSSS